jgi:hypothetical protein
MRRRGRRRNNTAALRYRGAFAREESLFEKLNPFKKKSKTELTTSEERQQQQQQGKKREKNELISSEQREQLFGKGLVGRVATGVINNIAGQIAEGMSEMQTNVEEAYEIARRKCERDGKLRDALGGGEVVVGPVTMQSSNSMNVNGKRSDVTRIGMIASSSTGSNIASIAVTMESVTTGSKNVVVVATLRSGERFEVDGVGGGGVGGNVDVVAGPSSSSSSSRSGSGAGGGDFDDFIEGEIIEASFEDEL